MKKYYSTAIGLAVAALLVLMVSGCTSALQGETKAVSSGGKVAVNLTLPTVSPALAKALNVSVTSGSRALLFLNSYSLSVYDQTAMSWWYSPTIAPVVDGPGGSQEYTLQLVPGRTYDIYLYGTNTTENPYGTTVMGTAYDQYISTDAGSKDIWINLKPYNPLTLASSAGSTISESIVKSVMVADPTQQGKYNFTKVGGEKWYTVTPEGNVFKATVSPKTGFLYAALFDSEGQFLTAGISPAFGGTSTVLDVTLEAGVTAGSPVYVGFVDIVLGDPVAGDEKDEVSIKVETSNLIDDDFDLYGNDWFGAAGYVTAPTAGVPVSITGLKAYDQDFYYFYAAAAGTYTVKITENDTAFPSGYLGELSLSGPSGYNYDSSYGMNGEIVKTSFQTSLTVTGPGYYYIDVGLRSSHPQFKFPILAGAYDMDLSYAP